MKKRMKRIAMLLMALLIVNCGIATSSFAVTKAANISTLSEFAQYIVSNYKGQIESQATANVEGNPHSVFTSINTTQDKILFSFEWKPTKNKTYPALTVIATMEVNLNNPYVANVRILQTHYNEKGKPLSMIEGTDKLIIPNYEADIPETFELTSNVGMTDANAQNSLNSNLREFLKRYWNKLVYNTTGRELCDLGFYGVPRQFEVLEPEKPADPVNPTDPVEPENPSDPRTPTIMNTQIRIYGQSRYETSLKVAEAMKEDSNTKYDAFVLVSGKNYPDALAGSFLSSRMYAPILLVDDSHINDIISYINKNISDEGSVIILGGTGAVSTSVENKLSKYFDTYRIGGSTRYETNLNIIETGLEIEESDLSNFIVFICSGTGYADSLSASSSGHAIMIVNPKTGITNEQINFLMEKNASQFVVVGGTKAVPASVETKLKKIGEVERLAGSTRYETSEMLAEYFATDETPNVVLAYGENFPDGLCAGPLALYSGANLILCKNSATSYAKSYVNRNNVPGGYVIGGPGLISDRAAMSIFGCNSISVFK